ncbi:Muscle M-line assembly protein unc-89 [Portunus trituberculatus]|uniref:Muscle M-line assembly protein unc-89 n=1 Tax=Portunus trituberculatus TaxID=210409 RepID=A0A5B7EXF3_PORTR|nr:Muscle M-line assembly protein unc-89 [Portunus trituberculatus]
MCFDGKKYTLERIGSDPEHTGEYKCVLRNKIAEAEEKGNITCQLGVLVKPAPGPLEDCVVDFGKDLQVSVTIHAFPKPVMVWTLNGQELKDGGESRYIYTRNEEREEYGLIVQNAVLEDDGKLAFTATNDAGSETRSCHLKVHYEKPTIVGGLENTAFCLEQDGTFTFRASGLPLPECSWTKNGIPLKNDNKHDITNPEPGVYCLTIKDVDQYDFGDFKYSSTKTSYCEATINLTIVEASAIDSGQYRLRCMNDVNEITTETAFIVRPHLLGSPTYTRTMDRIRTRALADLSDPKARMVPLYHGGRPLIFNLFSTITPERRKPKVTKKPQELKVLEQQPGIFQAKIIGFPKPEVKWLKDGRQVFPSDVIDIGVTAEGLYYLEFSSVTEEDKGRYTVTATNDLGSCEADTQLSVVPPPSKPEFLQSLRSSKVIMGYPVRMEVKLGGSPAPEIQW